MQHGNARTLAVGLLLVGGVLTATVHGHEWTHCAGDAAHSGTARRAPTGIGNTAWSAQPQSPPGELEEFVWRSGVVAADGRVFITGRRYVDDGTGLWEHTANTVICYDARSGARLWNTLINADIYEYDSWATPVVDRTGGTVIVASHFSVYALNVTGGEIAWERELPQVLVNASPTVSDDLYVAGVPANRVFITDYTGFTTTGGGLYAINVSPFEATGNPYEPGEIVWQDRTLPGTSGNTVAYADGYVYVGSTHGGVIRRYAALDGGAPGLAAQFDWETDTGISQIAQYAGFYGGVTVRGDYVYAAAYQFYGTGNSSRMYKLAADDGQLLWEQPCERTDSIPIVAENGRIYLAAGIEGFGSAVKIQAFQDCGDHAVQLWDTYDDTGGSLLVGGWTHQPLLAEGRLYCGTPDESQFFAPYTDLYLLDLALAPTDPGFVIDHASGSGGSSATTGRYLYSLGSSGLIAYRGCGEGDMDADGDVDADDFITWAQCMGGPDVTTPLPGCDPGTFRCADIDYDGDVDLRDFADMQRSFEGGL
ncbi:MAG: PQQ-binding-like beta-propeller repeat protein [Phycisphaerae bacterium]|nr:PQQ-binding-like beta-propeller repeat protein [Phycisphaerae bacterium]